MRYEAKVTREDRYWLAEVPGLSGAHAYARTLYKLRQELTDAIVLSAELDDESDVEVEFALASDATSRSDERLREAFTLATHRQHLAREESHVAERMAQLAQEAVADGWSVRDIAGALGITAGRVSQLTGSRTPNQPARTR